MSWSTSKNWGRKPVHERGQITWSDNTGIKPAPFAKPISRYNHINDIPSEYENFLCVGTLWSAIHAMKPDLSSGASMPNLVPDFYTPLEAPVKQSSFLIYSGIVRVEEREQNGRIVSVSRHSFIAGDARYIILNFAHIKPVV